MRKLKKTVLDTEHPRKLKTLQSEIKVAQKTRDDRVTKIHTKSNIIYSYAENDECMKIPRMKVTTENIKSQRQKVLEKDISSQKQKVLEEDRSRQRQKVMGDGISSQRQKATEEK